MKRIFTILLSFISIQLSAFAATVPVIITAGQSNTDGRVPSADMPIYLSEFEEAGGMPNVEWSYGNSGGWGWTGGPGVFQPFYPACESNNDRHRWAYDAVVYYNIGQHLSVPKLYVIKHSAGGTSIAPGSTSSGNRHWCVDPNYTDTAGSRALAPALVSNIRACLATIEANGDEADIRCILWHQGESDRTPTASANAYHDNLQAVVNYLRDSLVAITGNNAYASVPFICGTVSKKSALYNSTIEKAQYRLATEMTNFHVIDMQDGTMLSDNKHFDAASAELFGKRMYNKICALGLMSAYGVDAEDALAGVADAQAGIDFGDETVVTDTTEWVFTAYEQNATITDQLMCMNGLYLRGYKAGNTDHPIVAKSVNQTIAAYVSASPSFVSDISTAGMAVTSANDRSVALNIAYPGKVTVVARSNSSNTDAAVQAREMVLWFNGDTAAHKTLAEIAAEGNSYRTTLTLEAKTAGVVYLTCENAFYVFSVKYEPQPEMEGGDDIINEEEEQEQQQQSGGKRLHMCGDSMMSTYLMDEESNPEQFMGWGQVMEDYLEGLPVTNWAHTGRSAETFKTGRRMILGQVVSEKSFWQCVMDSLHAGDYVILSFGHNDQKSNSGYRTWRASEYGTSSKYDEYMEMMINEATAKGAQVIIASSICRNLWSGNHLTTLAQIDGSEEAGYTTVGSNHDFDFPYGAQQLAEKYNLPFINLTAETKKLLEGYGSKSAASKFYGNGGTTHTSELGARAVAMIADSILLELGVMTEYIKADAIDIPWYTAGSGSTEAVVADSTVWVFSGYTADQAIDSLHNQNGLYLRGNKNTSNHGFTPKTTEDGYQNQTFSNGAEVVCSQRMAINGLRITSSLTAGAAVTNSDDRCAAVNTSCPGTFYAIYYKVNSGRYVALSFDGDSVAAAVMDNNVGNVVELKYHADKGGTFVMWSNKAWSLMAAQFVPDPDNTEDEWREESDTPVVENNEFNIDGTVAPQNANVWESNNITLIDNDNKSNSIVKYNKNIGEFDANTALRLASGRTYTLSVPSNKLIASVTISGYTSQIGTASITPEGGEETSFTETTQTVGAKSVFVFDNINAQHFTFTISHKNVVVKIEMETTDVGHYPVTIGSSHWASFCAPEVVSLPEGVFAYTAESKGKNAQDEDVLFVNKVEGNIIPAGGYLLYSDVAGDYELTTSFGASAVGNNMLVGTTARTARPAEGTTYVLNGEGCLAPYTGNYIPANKAYLHIPADPGAPSRIRLVVGGENTATAVETVSDERLAVSEKRIENGQLIILRGGVKYNVQGQVIR